MSEVVRVGVIGCGFWGKNHLRVYSELENVELVAAADIDRDRLKFVEKRYGIETYEDYKEMLKRKDIDALSICTPSITHAEIALDSVRAGKHILVAKPMTTTVEDGLKLIEAAEEQGVILLVDHIERFNPGVQRVKEYIEAGKVGKVVLISSKRVSRWPVRIGDVGVVKDLAIHDVDIMRFLTNKDPIEVYAISGRIHHRYEDYANIILKFKDLPTAFIEVNWLTPKKTRKLIVTGSDGIITLDYITQEITIANSEGAYTPATTWSEPLKRELSHFIKVILGKEKPIVNGRDGLLAVYICEMILKSATEGNVLELKPPI
ncbi:MAG: Gfo/Idh/MocA family oxidoreductase [archaeon GB-1867-035]|nr:Gfo/Idh/MocA family oxidoreductase [Candidatus Culexmicrobium profundum]